MNLVAVPLVPVAGVMEILEEIVALHAVAIVTINNGMVLFGCGAAILMNVMRSWFNFLALWHAPCRFLARWL